MFWTKLVFSLLDLHFHYKNMIKTMLVIWDFMNVLKMWRMAIFNYHICGEQKNYLEHGFFRMYLYFEIFALRVVFKWSHLIFWPLSPHRQAFFKSTVVVNKSLIPPGTPFTVFWSVRKTKWDDLQRQRRLRNMCNVISGWPSISYLKEYVDPRHLRGDTECWRVW